MEILGLTKTTLLDYPEHVAATIFTGGCNLRCPFCHNRDLVFPEEGLSSGRTRAISDTEVFSFLRKRQNILTGVCITGGEPTLQSDLITFIAKIKSMGYHVKLDTNGFRPDLVQYLIEEGFIDYVAVDIKNSPQKYAQTAGISTCYLEFVQDTVSYLLAQDKISYEFRTTIVQEFHTEQDILKIGQWIEGAQAYYLQSFVASDHMMTDSLHPHTTHTLHQFLELSKKYVPNSHLRGVE